MSNHRVPLLPEEQIKIAAARTVTDWAEIYIEILARSMEYKDLPENLRLSGINWETFKNDTRPRIIKIAKALQAAGLTLTDEIEIEGVSVDQEQGSLIWEDPTRPVVIFFWPDGQKLKFSGVYAVSAMHFFWFWQNHQTPAIGLEAPQRRILQPGSADYKRYFAAKKKDLG